jgi:hypothetical protein
VITLNGQVRRDAAPGCPERFDWEFVRYVANFRRDKNPMLQQRLTRFPGRVIRFARPAEAQAFLDRLA